VTKVVPSRKQQGRGDAKGLCHQFESGGGLAQRQGGADLTYAVPDHLSQSGRIDAVAKRCRFCRCRDCAEPRGSVLQSLGHRRLWIICGAKLVGYCGQNSA